MTPQVKVNSITTFGTCCINNPIGICRVAKSISKSWTSKRRTERKRERDSRTWSQSRRRYSPEKSKGGDRHLRKLDSRILRIAPSLRERERETRELQLRRIDCTCFSRIRSSSKAVSSPSTPQRERVSLFFFSFFLYAALLLVEAQRERISRRVPPRV